MLVGCGTIVDGYDHVPAKVAARLNLCTAMPRSSMGSVDARVGAG